MNVRSLVLAVSVAVAALTTMTGCWVHAGPDRGGHPEERHEERHEDRR